MRRSAIFAMLPFLVLEAIGLVMLARSFPVAAALAAGLLAYLLLLSGPVAISKYRLPVEPVLLILAALPLATLEDQPCVSAMPPQAAHLMRSRMLT